MSSPSTPPQGPFWRSPRMFDCADYRRCYVLPETVETNIPRWGSLGEFGSFDYARGVLVELTCHLPATPVALHYRELATTPARLPVGIEITATVGDSLGELITVVVRRENAPHGPRGDHWELAVDGVVPADGVASHPPSLPWMARLVRCAVAP